MTKPSLEDVLVHRRDYLDAPGKPGKGSVWSYSEGSYKYALSMSSGGRWHVPLFLPRAFFVFRVSSPAGFSREGGREDRSILLTAGVVCRPVRAWTLSSSVFTPYILSSHAPLFSMSTLDNIKSAYRDVLDNLCFQAFSLRLESLQKLRDAFTTVDWDGTGICDKQDLGDVLNYCGLFLTTQQVTSVYLALDYENTGSISVGQFLQDLCPPLNARRTNIVQVAWASVAPSGGFVDQDQICACYCAAGHPNVKAGTVPEDQQAAAFAADIPVGGCDEGIFNDYWQNVSACCPRDDYFVGLVESVFLVKENQTAVDKPRLTQLIDVLRNKVIQKKKGGESQKVTLLRNLKFQDGDDADKLTPAEWNEAFRCVGIPLKPQDTDGFFYLYGREDGTIGIKNFVASFMGESATCEQVIADS